MQFRGVFALIHLIILSAFACAGAYFVLLAFSQVYRNHLLSILLDSPTRLLIPAVFFVALFLIALLLLLKVHRQELILLEDRRSKVSCYAIKNGVATWLLCKGYENLQVLEVRAWGKSKIKFQMQGDLEMITPELRADLSKYLLDGFGYRNRLQIELRS